MQQAANRISVKLPEAVSTKTVLGFQGMIASPNREAVPPLVRAHIYSERGGKQMVANEAADIAERDGDSFSYRVHVNAPPHSFEYRVELVQRNPANGKT